MRYDTKKILNTADSFMLAAARCMEQRPVVFGQFQMLVVPAIVSMALGTELYLKAIIGLETGNNERGHKLSVLFSLLSLQSQAALRTSISMADIAFDQKLAEVSAAFEGWRYIFEAQSANVDLAFLSSLATAARCQAESMANPAVNTDAVR